MLFRTGTFAAVVAAAALVGCQPPGDIEVNQPGTVTLAAAKGLSVEPAQIIANEGQEVQDGATPGLRIKLLCISDADTPNGLNVDVQINWGDGTAPDVATYTSTGIVSSSRPLFVGDTVGPCPAATDLIVCAEDVGVDTALGQCFGLNAPNHTYLDDSIGQAGGVYNISVTATHNGGSAQQFPTANIANLPPEVELIVRSGATTEGAEQTFEARISDPGTNATTTEMRFITWAFEPSAQVLLANPTATPEVISCDCDNVGAQCDDGSNEPLCDAEGGLTTTSVRPQVARYLDDGTYTFTLTVEDRQGATDSGTNVVSISNVSPSGLAVQADDQSNGAGFFPLSTTSGSPTPIFEGSPYTVEGDFLDIGIDQFDGTVDGIALNFGNGRTETGSGEVSKASYPGFDCDAPNVCATNNAGDQVPAVLIQTENWDDDNTDDGDPQTEANFPRTVNLTVRDDDAGLETENFFITIIDVNPDAALTSDATEVDEAQSINFNVVSSTGVFNDVAGFDDLTRNEWTCTGGPCGAGVDLTDQAGNEVVAGRIVVSSGCASANTGNDNCELLFLDGDDGGTNYTIGVEVFDEDSSTTPAGIPVTINDVDPEITIVAISDPINEGLANSNLGSVQWVFTDPAGSLDGPYTVTTDWGDLRDPVDTVTSGIAAPGGQTDVHTYRNNLDCNSGTPNGTCTVTVRVDDNEGSSDTTSDTITVQNVAPTPSIINPTTAQTLIEGQPFNLISTWLDPAQGTDNPYLITWTGDNLIGPLADAQFNFNNSQQLNGGRYAAVGANGLAEDLTVEVEDEDGNTGQSGSDTIGINVRDNRPIVTVEPTFTFQNGEPDEALARGVVDIEVSAESNDDVITEIRVDWGDGTSDVFPSGNPTLTTIGCNDPNPTTQICDTDSAGTQVQIVKSTPYMDNCQTSGNVCGSGGGYVVTVTIVDEEDDVRSNVTRTGELVVVNTDPFVIAGGFQPDPGATLVISEGEAASFVLEYNDASVPTAGQTPGDSDTLLFDVNWGDGAGDPNNIEQFVGTPTTRPGADGTVGRLNHVFPAPGTYTVQFIVRDKDAGGGPAPFDTVFDPVVDPPTPVDTPDDGFSIPVVVTVEVVNVAPELTDVFDTGPILENQEVTVAALVDNRGADLLDYDFNFNCTVSDGVDDTDFGVGLSVNNGDSAVRRNRYPQDGNFNVCVRVCDDDNLPNSCDFGSTVVEVINAVPVVTVTAAAVVQEGNATSVVVNVSDLGPDDSFTIAVDCGNGTSDTGAAGPGSGSDTLNCAYPDSGTFAITTTVNDDDDTVVQARTVTVLNAAPSTPTVSVAATPIFETVAASVTVSSSDVAADESSLSYTINWGDGTSDFIPNAGTSATQGHNYNSAGTFTVTATATDKDGGVSGVGTATIEVVNVAPTVTNVAVPAVDEGQRSTITVTASDPDNDPITSFNFDFDNDGVFEVTSASNRITRTFAVGTNNFSVNACDSDGDCSGDFAASAVVNNLNPTINAADINTPASVTVGSAATISVVASDPGNGPLTFNFNFGDGTSLNNSSSGTVSHTYQTAGTFTVTVTAVDAQGGTSAPTNSAPIVVNDINVLVNLTANPAQVNEGGTSDIQVAPTTGTQPFTLDFSYNINGTAFTEQLTGCNPADLSTCTQTLSFPDNPANEQAVRVAVQVTDSGGNVAAAAVNVAVANVAPTIVVQQGGGAITTLNATEEDNVVLDVVCADVAGDPTTASLVIGPSGVNVDASGAVTWTPNFFDANNSPNNLTFACADDDGASSTANVTANIVIIDNNNNGVSDVLETQVFGAPLNQGDPIPDTDGDGVDDATEVLDGTDPNISDSPTEPVLISPIDVTITTATVNLRVANAASPRGLPLSYTFTVEDGAGNEVGTATVAQGTGATTSVTIDISSVADNSVLTWFVEVDDGISTTLSETADFRVNNVDDGPPAPTNLAPVDASTFAFETIVTLEASAVVDPDGDDIDYVFEVADISDFSNIVVTSAARDVPFFTIGLLDPGTYHWRVTASDGANDAVSTSTAFTIEEEEILVNLAPSTPVIVGPSDETLDSTSATLTIEASTDPEGDAIEYEFEFANNPAFASATRSGRQAELTFDVDDLTENGTFFWRVRALDENGASDFATATFAVNAENEAPEGLAILSPTPGAVIDLLAAPESFLVSSAVDPDGDELTYTFTLADSAGTEVFSETTGSGGATTSLVPSSELALDEDTYTLTVTVTDGTNEADAVGTFTLFSTNIEVPEPGCGCDASGERQSSALGGGLALLAMGALLRRRRRRG